MPIWSIIQRGSLGIAVASGLWAGAAFGQAKPEDPKLAAYHRAVECFYANGRMVGLLTRRGQPERAAVYEANAERSHRGAVTLGRSYGLSDAQMAKDLDVRRTYVEFPRLLLDPDYFDRAVATCKAIGLM